jgi:inosine/xanthosine triphosphate pyrophosphatase family protein
MGVVAPGHSARRASSSPRSTGEQNPTTTKSSLLHALRQDEERKGEYACHHAISPMPAITRGRVRGASAHRLS